MLAALIASSSCLMAGPEWISGSASVSLEECGAPYVGTAFGLESRPRQATLDLAVCGWHELEVNGRRVGDAVLSPATCQPDQRVSEISYDVTSALGAGTNTISILLGNGWWSQLTGEVWGFGHAPWHYRADSTKGHRPPMVRVRLVVDGKTVLKSDRTWRAWDSPVVFNQFRTGERYDARLEGERRNERAATPCRPPPGVVSPDDVQPCRAFPLGGPRRTIAASDGSTIYDFGHNVSGWCEITVSGRSGDVVSLDYDESLDASGMALMHAVHALKTADEPAIEHDEYVCSGSGEERWHPRFAYHGFRYVQVASPETVSVKDIKAYFVHTDMSSAGRIETSDPLFARLQEATCRSYLSNFVGIPTDCPHREKNGWTGDAHLACETGLWNFDSEKGYRHFLQMAIDAQRGNGAVPCILPANPIFGYGWGSGPGWDAVIFVLPREIFRFTGDDSAARQAYGSMKRYREFIEAQRREDGLYAYGLGDWCPPDEAKMTDVKLTDSAFVWSFDRDLAFWARRFGETAVAEVAQARASVIRDAFTRKFYHGDGLYGNGEQTALAAVLYFKGLCADGAEKAVVERLVADVRRKGHVCDFGIFGAKWVPRVLAENGYADDAWKIFTQRRHPGYQRWLDQGEDTLWETFGGEASHNHIMFGDVSAWAYEYIAGIRIVEPGFRKIRFVPHRPPGIDSFEARHKTPYGEIRAGWRMGSDGKPSFFCEVPPGVEIDAEPDA